ncbi:MAG: 4-hydroxythreonine-4-phosphate dehydrogenase PdxA, partial [Lentisphaerota bacterium]
MNRIVTLGLTIGDVNGIGPEVSLKAAYRGPLPKNVRLVLVGSHSIIARQARALKLPVPPRWRPGSGVAPKERVTTWDPDPGHRLAWQPGVIDRQCGRAAAGWIRACVLACVDGSLQGMVTAPISKDAFHRAGIPFPGHTELLAELTGTTRFAMMLFGGPLKVLLATRHLPLSQVARRLSREGITESIELAGEALPWLGCRKRRIGVCALNPHGGDGGLLGTEEKRIILPAIQKARSKGFDVEGPVPADVIFYQARQGAYGAVVA